MATPAPTRPRSTGWCMNQSISFAPSQSQTPKGFGAGYFVPQAHLGGKPWFPPVSLRDGLAGVDLLGVDLLQARAFVVPRDLTLGGVSLRDRQVRRRSDFVGHRGDPLEQVLQAAPR